MKKKYFSFDARDYDFMQSLSAAVLEEHPKQFRWVIFFWLVSIVLFLLWATFAPIDEIVRGDGKVIPSGENQMIQHLEGGILGGISSGQEIVVGLALKPTSSIMVPGQTIDKQGNPIEMVTRGRHDPCVGIRAVPIAEAMLALVLIDHLLRHRAQNMDVVTETPKLK